MNNSQPPCNCHPSSCPPSQTEQTESHPTHAIFPRSEDGPSISPRLSLQSYPQFPEGCGSSPVPQDFPGYVCALSCTWFCRGQGGGNLPPFSFYMLSPEGKLLAATPCFGFIRRSLSAKAPESFSHRHTRCHGCPVLVRLIYLTREQSLPFVPLNFILVGYLGIFTDRHPAYQLPSRHSHFWDIPHLCLHRSRCKNIPARAGRPPPDTGPFSARRCWLAGS